MTTSRKRRALVASGAIAGSWAALGLPRHAAAQTYPNREIRLLVPLSAGSSVDTLARSFADEFGKVLGQPVVVENRPGAEGLIASEATARAAPDGHTLMLAYPGHALNVSLYPKLPYDTLKAFTPIALVASNVNVLVVRPESTLMSVPDLIATAKARPDTLLAGNAGGTSGGSADVLNYMSGIKARIITYKGAAEAQQDLIGGRIDFMFTAMSTAAPLVKAGRLRALAVTGARRHPGAPELPAVAEFVPGYETTGWYGLAGPADLPRLIVEKLNRSLFQATSQPTVRTRFATMGFDPAPAGSPEDFDAFIRSEIRKWGQVLRPRE
jgi:tripartite-type tricarboxylate transporter receptor subunit TctC